VSNLLNPLWQRYPKLLPAFNLISLMVARELKVKYRGSILGYLWSMLNPFFFMLILWGVFSHVMKSIPNYHMYVLSGILVWNFCNTSIQSGAASILNHAHLIKKVRTETWIFPLVPIGTAVINFLLSLVPFFIVQLATGLAPQLNLLWLLVLLPLLSIFLFGVALCLSCANAFFRDVGHVLEPIMNIVFYATPIVFDRKNALIPEKLSILLTLNPFLHFLEAFRSALIGTERINVSNLSMLFLISFVSLVFGLLIHSKVRRRIIFAL
jgi:ABC-type polysaccharide/polyol phosphate export permease